MRRVIRVAVVRLLPVVSLLLGILLLGTVLLLVGIHFMGQSDRGRPTNSTQVVPKIVVLMYHKVNSDPTSGGLGIRVPAANFENQLRLLKKLGYQSISPDELLDYLEGKGEMWPKAVLLTFDDGYRDNFTVARPILLKYDYRATIFLVSNRIGYINTWDASKGRPVNQLLNKRDVEIMLKEGFWIGAHTRTHSDLLNLPVAKAREEIAGSKEALENAFKIKVKYFCYPYGSYNKQSINLVKASGYRAGFTTAQGPVTRNDNPFTLRRIRVTGHYDEKQFLTVIGEK